MEKRTGNKLGYWCEQETSWDIGVCLCAIVDVYWNAEISLLN